MGKIKIVVVDDSPFSISILTEILTEKGFEVIGNASSLQETIEVVEDKRPDLVTMDMTMPGTDGLECTRAIHKIDPNIKVIIVSSMMDDEIVTEARENKVSGYVQKPVQPDEIATAIQRAMVDEKLFDDLEEIYFNVFKEVFSDNMNRIVKEAPSFEKEVTVNGTQASRGISIVVGVIGKYCGSMILDLSYETAEAMTKCALKREMKNTEESLAMMGEFANIISGNACSLLNRKNSVFGFRVAPPTIFHGTSLNVSRTILDAKSIIAQTIFGEISLNVGFKRGANEWM
ncbi:response regulator [Clostridium sp. FP1]|uniref:response regulator n=1 Tax=Clostridium sp. FP1 TaxID=2724076 RepID=UPI0013E8FBDD|nr:response regulator [Clostridium sp. FP1]MBZ9634973.1 response regulator [Clostridium sp. FP1]